MSIDLCFYKEFEERKKEDLPKCDDCSGYLTNCPYYIPRATDTEPYAMGVPEWNLDKGD